MADAQTTGIDIAALRAEIEALSPEKQAEELLKYRKQQVKQSKNYDKEKAKMANKRRRERFKLLKELAEKNGTYGKIEAAAKAAVEEEVGEEGVDEEVGAAS